MSDDEDSSYVFEYCSFTYIFFPVSMTYLAVSGEDDEKDIASKFFADRKQENMWTYTLDGSKFIPEDFELSKLLEERYRHFILKKITE